MTLKLIFCKYTKLQVSLSFHADQPEEEKAARGPYKFLQISEGWVSGGWGQTLFSGAQ